MACVLSACSQQEAGIAESQQSLESADEAAPAEAADAKVPADLAPLFAAMDAVGPGSDRTFNAAVASFARAGASVNKLQAFYRALPAKERGMAWKVVYVATSVRSAESVQFLEEVALAPIAHVGDPHGASTGANDDPGAVDMTVKLRAAVGLAQQLVAKTSGASASVERVLAQADVETSRMLGVELFSRGAYSAAHRAALSARGIFANFRKLTPEEAAAFRRIDPDRTVAKDKPASDKQVFTSVPAEGV